jgi:hypothetical protein
MVSIAGRFCIDRYEAATVDDVQERPLSPFYPPWPPLARMVHDDWANRLREGKAGKNIDLPGLFPYQTTDNWSPRAISHRNATPQGSVSKSVAQVACASAGKRLCTEEEWKTACRGENKTLFPYGPEYQQGFCNIFRDVHPAIMLHGVAHAVVQTDPRLNTVGADGRWLLHTTGGNPTCKSPWGNDGVYDMVGNLDEWVDGPEPVYVGGFYSRNTKEGCDYRNDHHKLEGPTFFNYSIGFRCCSPPAPH